MVRDGIPFATASVAQLGRLGVDVERVAAAAGVDANAGPTITTDQYFAFWRALDGEGRADLGLVLGAWTPTSGSSVASSAALLAPTFGEALRTFSRYKRLACPEDVAIAVRDGEVGVTFHWLLARDEVPRLLVDAVFASLAALAREGTGRAVAPLRIELARKSAHAAMLRAHFACPVKFGASVDRVVFAERALAAPMVTANGEVFARIVPGLEAELVGRRRSRTLVDDVRIAIARTMSSGNRPSIDVIAGGLRTSARTLQRKLGTADTTFQHELDEVRRLSARRLLARTDLDPLDISFLLGFSEPNSFTRAFRSWERTTPLRWRAARS